MTNATSPKTFSFASDLFAKALENRENYLEFETTADQFNAIQLFCSGNAIPASYEEAIEWAENRSKELDKEAQEYDDAGHGYGLPWGYCNYECSDHGVVYETTSGTLFFVFPGGETGVMLPKKRALGFHHKIICLIMGGIDPDFIEAGLNLHRYEGDHLKAIVAERSEAWDAILMPLGFDKQETLEQISRLRDVRAAFAVDHNNESDCDYEDYEDYEDA